MALVTVILVTMLCAALMVGFTSAIVFDQRSSGLDRDQTQAYAAAHAGLEKLTSDLSTLFRSDFSPSAGQITAIANSANQPSIHGFTFTAPEGGSGYTITWPFSKANGDPEAESLTGSAISAGPYQGFMGLITPYRLTVTARSTGGAEVRLRRDLQTVAIPVFQFGMFSETDLAFHAGADLFSFGGRVHTNGNLFLAAADGGELRLSDRITAVKEVVRTHLPNDLPVTDGYEGVVNVPKVIKVPMLAGDYRALARTEGSLKGTVGKPSDPITSSFWTVKNAAWDALSTGTYKSNIRNGSTGARRLDLPLVADLDEDGMPDAQPIELIRRPRENDPNFILQQRYFWLSSLRIMLSDDPDDIQDLPTVLQTSQPIALDGSVDYLNGTRHRGGATWKAPLAASAGPGASGTIPANTYRSNAGQSLIGGFIKIEMRVADDPPGTPKWIDVTSDILSLGIAGRNLADVSNATLLTRVNLAPAATQCRDVNPDAVIRLQRVRDVPAAAQTQINTAARLGDSCGYTVDAGGVQNGVSQNATDYWPNVLYDPREGQVRDGLGGNDMTLGGVMHYIEIDMNNLRRYLLGEIGTQGTQARNDNGFTVYFSDRRNNNDYFDLETGEYGYEDTVNPATGAGTPNGGPGGAPESANGLDAGEDVNAIYDAQGTLVLGSGSGTLQLYGRTAKAQNIPLGASLTLCNPVLPTRGIAPLDCGATVTTALTNALGGGTQADQERLKRLVARANKAILFRRALKIVNGGIYTTVQPAGSPTCSPANAVPCNNIIAPGLTIASENPVYIQGNFNATSASTTAEPNSATSVLADAVMVLSNNWNDIRSFVSPSDAAGRAAQTTGYRVAIVTGKTRPFPKPGLPTPASDRMAVPTISCACSKTGTTVPSSVTGDRLSACSSAGRRRAPSSAATTTCTPAAIATGRSIPTS
jgi:hypothetical protein